MQRILSKGEAIFSWEYGCTSAYYNLRLISMLIFKNRNVYFWEIFDNNGGCGGAVIDVTVFIKF